MQGGWGLVRSYGQSIAGQESIKQSIIHTTLRQRKIFLIDALSPELHTQALCMLP